MAKQEYLIRWRTSTDTPWTYSTGNPDSTSGTLVLSKAKRYGKVHAELIIAIMESRAKHDGDTLVVELYALTKVN